MKISGAGIIVIILAGIAFYLYYTQLFHSTSRTETYVPPSELLVYLMEGDGAARGIERGSTSAIPTYIQQWMRCWEPESFYPHTREVLPSAAESIHYYPSLFHEYLDEISGIATAVQERFPDSAARYQYDRLFAYNLQYAYASNIQTVMENIDASKTQEKQQITGYHIAFNSPPTPNSSETCLNHMANNQLLYLVRPSKGAAFMFFAPSFSVGALGGMNEYGLVVALMSNEAYDDILPIPPTWVVRFLLQYCRSKDDAYYCIFSPHAFFKDRYQIDIPTDIPISFSGKYLIMDTGSTGSVYTVSQSQKRANDFPMPGGYKLASSVLYDLTQYSLSEIDSRIAFLKKRLNKRLFDEETVYTVQTIQEDLVAFHQEYHNTNPALFAVFVPIKRQFYLATGVPNEVQPNFIHIDLEYFLTQRSP